MDKIRLPEQLEGNWWRHALFLTYGVDVPFFERAIWRVLGTRCTNIVIIGDGQHYLQTMEIATENHSARWVNQQYIFDGIHASLFHPKAVLLASEDRGRLLVGSGNLGLLGYASGAEMFVQYEYSHENDEHLVAFASYRDYLQQLIAKNYLLPRTVKQIQAIFDQSPWIYLAPPDINSVFRSNLDQSFMDQFIHALGGEPVEELRILSPFYDEVLVALKQLINRANPLKTIIYIQEGATSIDPTKLAAIVESSASEVEIQLVDVIGEKVNIHNKLFIAKQQNKAVCLQGSPNLSQAGFTLKPPIGNFETANILQGARDEFDAVFDQFLILPNTKSIVDLDVEFGGGPRLEKDIAPNDELKLIGGEWKIGELQLFFRGLVQDFSQVKLIVNDLEFPVRTIKVGPGKLTLSISEEIQALLSSARGVAISLGNLSKSNPVYPCNIQELDRVMNIEPQGETLSNIGSLELEDKELESLLLELENALVLDTQGIANIWHSSTSSNTPKFDEGSEAIKYSDIDYDKLRLHPKIAQYRGWKSKGNDHSSTNLQIILNSITDHFNGLSNLGTGKGAIPLAAASPEETLIIQDDEEEVELEDKELEKRERVSNARMRKLMRRFIRRYLNGISSPNFLSLVEADLIANNFVIFTHILWRLFSFEWMEDEFVLNAYLESWEFMFGNGEVSGYYDQLDSSGKEISREILSMEKAVSRSLASFYYGEYLTRMEGHPDSRFALRDATRRFIADQPIPITETHIGETWQFIKELFPYQPPTPSEIIDRLRNLCRWDTGASFIRALEVSLDAAPHTIRLSANTKSVMRPSIKKKVEITQLIITDPEIINTLEKASLACSIWADFQKKDFYRIVAGESQDNQGNQVIFFYDAEYSEGVYFNRISGEDLVFEELQKTRQKKWKKELDTIATLAKVFDAQLL